MLCLCDVVFICLYPKATLEFLKEHKNSFKRGAIVTDISGVKGIFEKELPSLLRPDTDFIIGHPMAGGEKEGYAASNAKFFVNHNYILIPQSFNKAENLELMKSLVSAMGFTRITETTCDIHDYKIGFTSQLCHVIASALVEAAPDNQITAFGGGSFEDHFTDLEPLYRGVDELYGRLMDKSEGVWAEAGVKTVILGGMMGGMLAHEAVGHTVEADLVLGGSVAGPNLHKRVASDLVTLVDYAHTAFGETVPLPVYLDDEGTVAQDVTLIQNGILTGSFPNGYATVEDIEGSIDGREMSATEYGGIGLHFDVK
jgi:hypothetical protein